jgi:hypothetical protein
MPARFPPRRLRLIRPIHHFPPFEHDHLDNSLQHLSDLVA